MRLHADQQGTTTHFDWYVMMPSAGDFTLPKISPVGGDAYPKAGDSQDYGTSALIELDGVNGYDAARPHLFELFRAWSTRRLPSGSTTSIASFAVSSGGGQP